MAFLISSDVASFTCGAGEPITFAYVPCDSSGKPEPLGGRCFVWAVYTVSNGVRQEVGYYDATVADKVYWMMDGRLSNSFYGMPNLRWDIAERKHNGRETVRSGTLVLQDSAPRIDDLPGASIASYIHQITRLNDPSTIDLPKFQVSVVAYTSFPTSAGLDLSSNDNSFYSAVLAF